MNNPSGLWTVHFVTESYQQYKFEHCTDLALMERGWCSFKDAEGRVRMASGSILLTAEKA